MNPDDYIQGTFNNDNPANIEEIECTPQTELEEQQDWNQELLSKINKTKAIILEFETSPNTVLIKLKKLYKL